MKPNVFINYRRDDSSAESQLLRGVIEKEYGEGFAFLDVSDIEPGQEWPEQLKTKLTDSTVFLVVVGKGWLTAGISEHGVRRIDDEADWVRLEIELAIKQNKKIIPVLVDNSALPPAEALPDSIKPILEKQKVEIRRDSIEHDAILLFQAIDKRTKYKRKTNRDKPTEADPVNSEQWFEGLGPESVPEAVESLRIMVGRKDRNNAIFLSYRRSDSAPTVGRLIDRLELVFGQKRVFRDLNSIEQGQNFEDVICAALIECKVVLVVIGNDWVSVAGRNGRRRLETVDDWVRSEVRQAIEENKIIIPILVNGATMPYRSEIPADIESLTRKHHAVIRDDPDFNNDVTKLIASLEKIIEPSQGSSTQYLVVGSIVLLSLVTFLFIGSSILKQDDWCLRVTPRMDGKHTHCFESNEQCLSYEQFARKSLDTSPLRDIESCSKSN